MRYKQKAARADTLASASGQKNTRQKRVDNKKPAWAGVYKTR
jgi:hypothetical protein